MHLDSGSAQGLSVGGSGLSFPQVGKLRGQEGSLTHTRAQVMSGGAGV